MEKRYCMEREHCPMDGFKLWAVAKQPKIVFATYQSDRKTDEVKICDSIIDSFKFDL